MIILATAGLVVPLVQRFKISPVLGYLVAGALLGPKGLGALAPQLPALYWVTISHEKGLGLIGELGVVFLLFLIGLELSMSRLLTMRRLVFGLGLLQVVVSALFIGGAAALFGVSPAGEIIIGFGLALSSTAIVIEVLSQQRRLNTATGRASFAVLLLQDLAVVPLLFLVTILGQGQSGSLMAGLALAFGQAALAVGLVAVLGGLLLRPLFRMVAANNSTDLFMATILLVAVASGFATAAAGLSMALGAFIAGLLLAETEFRKAIEVTIDPFKGLLLGIFFFSVGMSLDLAWLMRNPVPILAGTLGLIVLKSAILIPLARLFRLSWRTSIEMGMLLAPGGEFAFIVIGLASAADLINPTNSALALAVTSLSMVLIPVLDLAGKAITRRLAPPSAQAPELQILPPSDRPVKAIVIGHGRVGELVSDMLSRHGVSFLVTELDPDVVASWRRRGRDIYFGDSKTPQFLLACGIMQAEAVIITIHGRSEIDNLVTAIRKLRPDIVIVARARDADHARHLYELGVTDAVPETIEASLQLSEAALVGLGIMAGPVIASIHEKRDEYRKDLQTAAGRHTHAFRRSSSPARRSGPTSAA
ncbi:MAG: cation:proton antiporter [Hyphomicrobiaceae bacterium]